MVLFWNLWRFYALASNPHKLVQVDTNDSGVFFGDLQNSNEPWTLDEILLTLVPRGKNGNDMSFSCLYGKKAVFKDGDSVSKIEQETLPAAL